MNRKCPSPLLLTALVALSISARPGLGAEPEIVYSDNFEANVKATTQFPVPAHEGHQFLELSRVGGRPTLTATFDPAQVSEAGDEIQVELAVRTDGGVYSLYGKAGDALNGQIGFWGDNRVGVVDPTQNSWQYLTAPLNASAWNTVVIKYVNGSGVWAISVNGSAFESFSSYGSGTLSAVRLQTDSGGTVSYTDVFVIRNATKSSVLFSDNFEEGGPDTVPGPDTPQTGTWTDIDGSATLLVRNDQPVTAFGPLAQPQVGTNLAVGAPAKASDVTPPGPHGGSVYLLLDRGAARQDQVRGSFTKTAAAVSHDTVHAEAWIQWGAGLVQWGLDSTGSGYDAIVTLWPESDGYRVTVYDGTAHQDIGVPHQPGAWAKYAIDYAVGASQITLTVNGVSAVSPIPPVTQVRGLWLETGDAGSLGYVDDVMASIQAGQATPSDVLFKDGFERSTVGEMPGVNDPEAGIYATAGVASSSSVQVLSGPSFGGPSAAHGGQNYLVVDRANTGQRPILSALFASGPFTAKTKAFHIEFYRWQPATADNYGNIALGNSATDWGATYQFLYGISWPDDLSFRAYDGSAYVPSVLRFTADQWDKVELDWDGARLTSRINGGDPAELTLFGTPDNTIDRLYFETSGGGTVFYLDDLFATLVAAPPTQVVSTTPKDGQADVAPDTRIEFKLADGSQQVQVNSIRLTLDGVRVDPNVSQATEGGRLVTAVTFVPPAPFAFGSAHTARLVYNDNASPPNVSTVDVAFVVATGTTLFADNFEDSLRATNVVQFLPYQGAAFLEINRTTGQHPHLFAEAAEGLASNAGDEITIQFAVRVLTGEVSLYPRDVSGGSTSGATDTGQLGFFADGRVGIVDEPGAAFQFLTQTVQPDIWNTVVVNYVNGSGEWAVSVNGGTFESRRGMGSDGGSLGLNVAGFKVKCDAAGISYLDAFTISNKTTGTLLFAANFDNGTIGETPAATDPQVGTWYATLAPAGLVTRDAVAREVVTDAPPNAPQVGSYAAATALVETAGAHSGTKSVYLYPALGHGAIRPRFTTPVPQGIKLHAEAWLYHVGEKMHWGLDTPSDPLFVNVTLQPPSAGFGITVSDGTTDVDTGLTYAENTWEKYQLDYVVGSTEVLLTVNDQSVTLTVPARTEVTGLWFISGLEGDDFQSRGFVDDILASAPVMVTPTQPTLRYEVTGKQLKLSWEGSGFALQENEAVANPAGWQAIGNASPVTFNIGAGNKFYRLRK